MHRQVGPYQSSLQIVISAGLSGCGVSRVFTRYVAITSYLLRNCTVESMHKRMGFLPVHNPPEGN